MKKTFIFLITMYILLFSVINANSIKEGEVEIEVELEVIKDLNVKVTPMHFGNQMPGATNVQSTSNIEVEGESGRWVFVQFVDKNNSNNNGYVYLINQEDQTKKQRVDLRLESSDYGYLYINNTEVKDRIIGTIDKVVDDPGHYEGVAIVKVRYN
ncbi:hypothetical protein [Fusobacterium sp. MFO224]|uniref:hypothetical protein n=1 Tax=Fusobacterium sp. MFO224 TaxID=3378070 RepID=UPI00385321D5